MKKKLTMATEDVIIPSAMNYSHTLSVAYKIAPHTQLEQRTIHRHPSRPPTPSAIASRVENSPLKAPAMIAALKNTV